MDGIRVDRVMKDFGPVRALDGVSLEVMGGEMFFLLGASGCGKTTLLRCLAGLERPDSGRVYFGDQHVTDVPPHRREAAMMFQSYALWPHLTVEENVGFGLVERRVARAEMRGRVAEALDMVRLAGLGGRSIDQLSGGQQQRVALARALVVRPRCLLLDEPLSNLDAGLRVEMRREIRRIVKEHGLTAVYVTHDQEEALVMADRMAVMAGGRVVQTGAPEEVYRHPRSVEVARFIGETNLVAGTVGEVLGVGVIVETAVGRLEGRLSDPGWIPAAGESVVLSIRPEAWSLHAQTGDHPVAGRIAARTYLGQRIQYEVETGLGRQQVVELNPRVLHDPGEASIVLHVRADDVVVLRRAGTAGL